MNNNEFNSRTMLMAVLSKLLSTKRTKLVQERVELRFRANKCIGQMESELGGVEDCENSRGARLGLCDWCYSRHNSVMKSFGDDYQSAAEHEARMIREGLVLRGGESRELSNRSLLRRKRA